MKKLAFTMAEILLSLTIIGVVAAITLPSLMGNINERTWNTQRKALYARMSQAIGMMPNLNGYGTYSYTTDANTGVHTVTADTAAETFLTDGLSKVLKINNICDYEHLQDCGIVSTYTNFVAGTNSWSSAPKLSELNSMFTGSYSDSQFTGVTFQNPQSAIDTKAAAFETQNGESVLLFYNPQCTGKQETAEPHYVQPKMCANFIYDLNGNKGPNTVGKDIGFITAMYATDSVVVAPVKTSFRWAAEKDVVAEQCRLNDPESRLPNIEELSAMFYNSNLLGIQNDDVGIWSSTSNPHPLLTGYYWVLYMKMGRADRDRNTSGLTGYCVKR